MTPRERHGLWVTGELWVIPPVPTSDGPKSMGYRKLWVIRRYGLWGVRLYSGKIGQPTQKCAPNEASRYRRLGYLAGSGKIKHGVHPQIPGLLTALRVARDVLNVTPEARAGPEKP